jgi:demethylmenaquinone methyltransferase/2-methoxy-6-polyprenyl-1,4-benzoquinol methylase
MPPHPPLAEFYPRAESRAGFVADLFDGAAADYEWIDAVLSLGTGRRYRREALERAGARAGMRLLDVATGTGLMAGAALELGIEARRLVGLDPSHGMLRQHRRRRRTRLVGGRGEELPFAAGAFDLVTMGYALRHVSDLGALFAQFHRVLRPDGRVLLLEISRPATGAARLLLRLYLHTLAPLLIRAATGRRRPAQMMRYFWATIENCVPPPAILASLAAAGFGETERRGAAGFLSEFVARRA